MATNENVPTLSQMNSMPRTDKVNAFKKFLKSRANTLLDFLPPGMQTEEQANRMVNRAGVYFMMKGHTFDAASVFQAILQAAEVGLAIDGKLAHVVNFGGEAVLNIDYKGLIAVAKRSGQIYDVQGDIVGDQEEFTLIRENEKTLFRHAVNPRGRGSVIGAYARLTFRERVMGVREFRVEYLTRQELDAVKAISKAKHADAPWQKWPEQMQIKTAIRRGLKSYADDPSLARAFELSDAGDGGYTLDVVATPARASVSTLNLSAPQPVPQQALGREQYEPLDLPKQETPRETVDATPRSQKKKQQQQEEERREEPQQTEESGDAAEETVAAASEAFLKWKNWVAKQTEISVLEESFQSIPDDAELTVAEKTDVGKLINTRIRELKGTKAGPKK